jgi:hypothetical protein
MKKQQLFLSSFSKLFLLLAVTIVTSAIATKAQAQWGSGFSFWPGSDFTAVIKLGDLSVKFVTPTPNTPSVCGSGFVDILANSNFTDLGQTSDCTLVLEDGSETPAQCQFSGLQCNCFQVGTCKGGTRTSTMTCPTPGTNGPNSAGCTGSITVYDLNGVKLNHTPNPIPIGDNLAQLNTNTACGQAFPNDSGSGLKKFVMGTLTQECTASSTSDLVLQEKVRSTTNSSASASFFSTTEWFNGIQLTSDACNPNNGFPPNSCSNDSGANITFPAAANGDTCNASNFSCGQLDGDNGPLPGPHPSSCTTDNNGNCKCRCARCTPAGTLTNLGAPGTGLFVIASADNAYACPVTVTGNGK